MQAHLMNLLYKAVCLSVRPSAFFRSSGSQPWLYRLVSMLLEMKATHSGISKFVSISFLLVQRVQSCGINPQVRVTKAQSYGTRHNLHDRAGTIIIVIGGTENFQSGYGRYHGILPCSDFYILINILLRNLHCMTSCNH